MPQMNPELFAPQLVWLLITFVILYVVMARAVLPRISDVIATRNQRRDSDLAEAEELRRNAEAAHENYEKALADAKARAHEIAQETRDRLNEETAKMRAETDEKLAKQAQEAEERIKAAKEEALGNVRDVAAESAAAVVERLIGQTPDSERVTQVVDTVLSDRKDIEEAA